MHILPNPADQIGHSLALPKDIQAAIERLSAPFPIEEVKARPGAIRRDGAAALCLAYSDWWSGYLPRLNDAIGPHRWQITLRPWGEHQIIARLSAFGGLIISESSGSAKGDANGAQEAEAQAKKRVCAEGLRLGRYFYALPKVWGKGERLGKDFVFAEGEEQRCVYEMYVRAGLLARRTPGMTLAREQPPAPRTHAPVLAPLEPSHPTVASARRPDPRQLTRARAVLAEAERRVGAAQTLTTQPPPATDPQLGKIIMLVQESPASNAAIDRLGTAFGFVALSALDTKAALRQAHPDLARRQASKLIDALQQLAQKT